MGGIVAGVVGIVGGVMGAGAAKSAAGAQTAANEKSLQFQQQVYQRAQDQFQPYIASGGNALNALNQFYGLPSVSGAGSGGNALDSYRAFMQTPFYKFPLQQAQEASERSAAARGTALSFGQRNELQKLSSNYAGSNFENYRGALASLAGLGQNSVAGLSDLGFKYSGLNATTNERIGNAQAAGIIGAQNQINNALNNIPLAMGFGNAPTGTNNSTTSGYSGGGILSSLFG